MFEWLFFWRHWRRKNANKFWVLFTHSAAETGTFTKQVNTDNVPLEEMPKAILAAIKAKTRFSFAQLVKFAGKYYFTSSDDCDAFLSLCRGGSTSKASAPEPSPLAPTGTGEDPAYLKWLAETSGAANGQRPPTVDLLTLVMEEQPRAKAPPAQLPKSLTGPGRAIGVRIDDDGFLFINKRLIKGQTLNYATDEDIRKIAEENGDVKVATQLIYHDIPHAIKMQKALIKRGLKKKS